MPDEELAELVRRGLRAQLGKASLLTGGVQIELNQHPNAPPAEVRFGGRYPEIPTIPTTLDQIGTSVARLLERFQQVPVEEIGSEMKQSLKVLRETLEETRQAVASDSAPRQELQRALIEFGDAARAVRLLAESLERNPESLVRGKGH